MGTNIVIDEDLAERNRGSHKGYMATDFFKIVKRKDL